MYTLRVTVIIQKLLGCRGVIRRHKNASIPIGNRATFSITHDTQHALHKLDGISLAERWKYVLETRLYLFFFCANTCLNSELLWSELKPCKDANICERVQYYMIFMPRRYRKPQLYMIPSGIHYYHYYCRYVRVDGVHAQGGDNKHTSPGEKHIVIISFFLGVITVIAEWQ